MTKPDEGNTLTTINWKGILLYVCIYNIYIILKYKGVKMISKISKILLALLFVLGFDNMLKQ